MGKECGVVFGKNKTRNRVLILLIDSEVEVDVEVDVDVDGSKSSMRVMQAEISPRYIQANRCRRNIRWT